MLTLLAGVLPAILGILSSAIPQLVNWLENGQRFKHEIELTKLRMEAAAKGLDRRMFIESVKASAAETESLRRHDTDIPSNKYIDILRASVRPVITYSFFIAFVGIKIAVGLIMFAENMPAKEILSTLWDEYTNAVFGACIGFYFGNRAFIHMTKEK